MYTWSDVTESCRLAFAVYDIPVDDAEFDATKAGQINGLLDEVKWSGWTVPPASHFGPKTDTQVFHFRKEQESVFAFRGTEFGKALEAFNGQKLKDILIDIQVFHPEVYRLVKDGHIHRGFAAAVEEVWPWLKEQLAVVRGNRISFVGHSLGGALAMLAALWAVDDAGADVHSVITFGAPRFCDTLVAAHYNAKLGNRTIRCVDDKDVIGRVPPRAAGLLGKWKSLNWSHVGLALLMNQDTGPVTDWQKFIEVSFLDQIQEWLGGDKGEPFNDHLRYWLDLRWNEQFPWPEMALHDPPG